MRQLKRITVDPRVMGGKPCIRNMRVTVGTIVGLIGAGRTPEDVLEAYPYLEREDILEALSYKTNASDLICHGAGSIWHGFVGFRFANSAFPVFRINV